MELIVISNKKLKIMLSPDDMSAYSLGDSPDYADIGTRRALRRIIADAGEKCGIDLSLSASECGNGKVFIQLFTSRRGGCELYVTRCGDEGAQYYNDGFDGGEGVISLDSEAKETAGANGGNMNTDNVLQGGVAAKEVRKKLFRVSAFAFYGSDGLTKLISACRRLKSRGIYGGDAFFIENEGGYYCLIISLPYEGRYGSADGFSFVCEYGKEKNPQIMRLYIGEYGTELCRGDAVERFSAL